MLASSFMSNVSKASMNESSWLSLTQLINSSLSFGESRLNSEMFDCWNVKEACVPTISQVE